MKSEDVWVIFNKITGEIKLVFAERFMAEREHARMLIEEVSGTTPNKNKLIICTLPKAVRYIVAAELADKAEEKALQDLIESRW